MRKVIVIFALFLQIATHAQTPPASQPTHMVFASVRTYSLVMSFTPSTSDGFLVLKSDQWITDTPTDGTTYQTGQGLNTCKVMYVGQNNIFNVREVLENTKYYFKVFAYNGSGVTTKYLTVNPLTDSVETPASDAGSYYDNIHSNSPSFLDDLHSLISSHTMIAYTSYRSNMVPGIFERDTVNGQVVIECEYSNNATIYTPPFDFTAQGYNREHALPKSWMLTGGNTNSPDGADYYNLLLTLATPNGMRSNYSQGKVVNASQTFGACKFGIDSFGNNVFEPQDKRKGDVARNMFYQMICYNGNGGTWGFDYLLTFASEQNQSILKAWHNQDPPDKFERTKNEFISSLQGNRNPFIDHPEWIQCINFDSLLKTSSCIGTSIAKETESSSHKMYPNPANDYLLIELNEPEDVAIFNSLGKLVLEESVTAPIHKLNISEFSNGVYFIQFRSKKEIHFSRFEVMN